MMLSIIGQLHFSGRNISDIRVLTFSPHSNNYFLVCVYIVGCSKIFVYEIQESNENENVLAEILEGLECIEENGHRGEKYKLNFLKSYVLPFGVYFLINMGESLWAISHESLLKFKICAFDKNNTVDRSSKDGSLSANEDKPMEIDPTTFREKNLIFKIDDGIIETKSGGNPICAVSHCSRFILFCRRNCLQHCWTIEILLSDKVVKFLDVPYVKAPISHEITKQEYKVYDLLETNHRREEDLPVMLCIEAEGEDLHNNFTLKKSSFMSFFGSDVSSNYVVLIGLPDGRILWNVVSCNAVNGQSKSKLLCNMEQPVCSICIKKHNISEDCYEFLVVIGAYGKVIVLAPELCHGDGVEETSPSFMVTVLYIPSPVDVFSVHDRGILHSASCGRLWVSNMSFEETDFNDKSNGKNIIINSQLLNMCSCIHASSLNSESGLMICVTCDGNVYLGNFFEENLKHPGASEEEMPILLKSIYQYGDQLQQLEILAQKQKKLFSALAMATKLKFQGKNMVTVICSVTEIEAQTKKFIISVEFRNLNELCLDLELWHLSVNISDALHCGEMNLSRCVSMTEGKCYLNIEVEQEMFAFNSCSIFPLLVQGGLLLSIPTEWQSMICFQSVVSLMPIYIEIQSIVVHELYVLKVQKNTRATTISTEFSEMKECNNLRTSLCKMAATKPSAAYFQSKIDIKKFDLPQKFSFLMFKSNVQSLLKINMDGQVSEDMDLAKRFYEFLTSHSHLNLTSKDSLTCLNHPIEIKVCSKENFLCVTISTSSFPLLVGLKTSIIQMLKGAHKGETHDGNISISSDILRALEKISTEISMLLCQEQQDISSEDIAVYKKLRQDISSNLCLL